MNQIGECDKMGHNVKMWQYSYISDETVIDEGTSIGSLVYIDRENSYEINN
jgi:UDP-3-O-[3-hydroxymyristoyl] glucosamine N-acyltransferase